MNRLPFAAFLVIVYLIVLISCNQKDESKFQKIETIAGDDIKLPIISVYFHPSNRDFDFEKISAEKISILNFAFTIIENNKLKFANKNDLNSLKKTIKLKDNNKNLKILITVGGIDSGKSFSKMAQTKESRKIFINSLIGFIRLFKLDGVDLDWEYPCFDGKRHFDERFAFHRLLKEIRFALDEVSKIDKKKYYFTIAAGAYKSYLRTTQLHFVHQYVDFVNIMSYDFAGQWNKITGHHTNLYPSMFKIHAYSVSKIIHRFIHAGIPTEKLIIGAGIYGRKWKNVADFNNGLYQKGKGVGSVSFKKICNELLVDTNYIKFWDSSARASYIWNENKRIFISYEDERSINEKVDYLMDIGMGGIMFWDYFSDNDEHILNTIDEKINENRLLKNKNFYLYNN